MWKVNQLGFMAENPDTGAITAPIPAADSGNSASPVVNDWADMASDGDGDLGIGEGAESIAPPAPVASPSVPVVPAAPVPAAGAEPTVPPQTQAEPAPVQPAPAQSPEQPVDLGALRENYRQLLTQDYAISPEDALRLQTEPEQVLPALAAKVHLQVLDAISAQLPNRVGNIVTQIIEGQKRESEAQESFFGAFPDLKNHRDAVLRVGMMYRAANPTAPKEAAIKAIGDFVRQSLGLSVPSAAPPQASVQQANVFTPAQSAGGGNTPVAGLSLWDEMLIQDD